MSLICIELINHKMTHTSAALVTNTNATQTGDKINETMTDDLSPVIATFKHSPIGPQFLQNRLGAVVI